MAATPEDVWRLVSDPWSRPRWWPRVERVEEASSEAFTDVMRSAKGKAVRADHTVSEADPLHAVEWLQAVEETPFERFLGEARTRLSLAEGDGGSTRVEIAAVRRFRGLAWLGSPLARRALRRDLDEALERLAEAVER